MILDDFSLKGKRAVITGAAGIICGCLAEKLAEAGAHVALLDLFEDKAQIIADRINKNGGKAIAVQANVLIKASLCDARQRTLEALGGVDILINGAGGNKKEATVSPENSFFEIPEDAMRWVFDLNFTGAVLTTQVFGHDLIQAGDACIINISSMAAILPLTNTIAYSAAKAALSNFTQWMAVHFNHNYSKTVRVNAIAPGFLLTEQNRFLMINAETGQPSERGQKVLNKTPMCRYGNPEDLCGAVIWLCSTSASFVTGIVLPIDGGFSAYAGV